MGLGLDFRTRFLFFFFLLFCTAFWAWEVVVADLFVGCLVGGGLALRAGLRLVGCVGVGGAHAPDWFIACTTALAVSDARRSRTGASSGCGCGGASLKPSYAFSMYQEFFHLVLSWALWTIWL